MLRIIVYSILTSFILSAYDHKYPLGWEELQNDDNWKLIKKTDRVKIFSKQISSYPLPAHRAEIISLLDMETLINTVWQVEKSVDVFPNAYIIDAGIYHKRGGYAYTAYQIFDIPFLSTRLYQFNSIRQTTSVHWARTDTLNKSYNPDEILLPPVNFGSWEVEKYNGKTKLIYRLCTDPGGNVPLWIVDLANKQYLPQMLLDLESYASKD